MVLSVINHTRMSFGKTWEKSDQIYVPSSSLCIAWLLLLLVIIKK
jgi:hypothetical protein